MLLKVEETIKIPFVYPAPVVNAWNVNGRLGKIVLSGSSGMLGSALRSALEKSGAEVIRLVRSGRVAPGELYWEPAGARPLVDTWPLERMDVFIHLSGANLSAKRWTRDYQRQITDSRVTSTLALSEALASLNHPPSTFLVASAVGIYGNRGDEVLDESSAPGTGFLADLCQQWEAATWPAIEAGIRVVHLRFGVVLAAGAGALAQLLPLFRLGLGGRLGSGTQWMSWISLTDLVAAVMFVLDSPTLSGAVNLTSPQPVTNADFTHILARQLQRPAILPAPAFALRLALGRVADEALLSSTRAVPRRLFDAGFPFAHSSIEGALRAAIKS